MECYSPISEDQNSAISSNMDGLRGHYAQGNESDNDCMLSLVCGILKKKIQQTSECETKKKQTHTENKLQVTYAEKEGREIQGWGSRKYELFSLRKTQGCIV